MGNSLRVDSIRIRITLRGFSGCTAQLDKMAPKNVVQ